MLRTQPKSPGSVRPGGLAQPAPKRPSAQTAPKRLSAQTANYLHLQIARAEKAHRDPAPRRQVNEALTKARMDAHVDSFERVYAAREEARKNGNPWPSDALTYVSNGTARTARTNMSRGSRGNSGDEWMVGDPVSKLPIERRKTLMRMHAYRTIITLLLDKVDDATRTEVVEMMNFETSQNRSMADSIYKALVRKSQETGEDAVEKFIDACKAANVCRNGDGCWFLANGSCIANHPPRKTPPARKESSGKGKK